MTKGEYRTYLGSEYWQTRRREFLENHAYCNACDMPRWVAVLVYDQDLHVDHKNYQHLGSEKDADLQALCARCHELKHFGVSKLSNPQAPMCAICGSETWLMNQGGVCGCCDDEIAHAVTITNLYPTLCELVTTHGKDEVVKTLSAIIGIEAK